MGVTLDDVIEMHPTIRALEERQASLFAIAKSFVKEAEHVGDLIATLRRDYEVLRDKTK